ncbi:PilZ domain-containing protein [Tsuneonella sp. HG249]
MIEPLLSPEPAAFVERRASRRVQVKCEAVLETMTKRAEGQLVDISEAGARLELADMPPVGSTAVLRWAGHEAVCSVIWVEDRFCGVSFRSAITSEIVGETAALNRVLDLPIAQVGNIAQGQKRSAFRARLFEVPDGEEP